VHARKFDILQNRRLDTSFTPLLLAVVLLILRVVVMDIKSEGFVEQNQMNEGKGEKGERRKNPMIVCMSRAETRDAVNRVENRSDHFFEPMDESPYLHQDMDSSVG
jgi:hypothetical protein